MKFDYVTGINMWKLLSTIKNIWEHRFSEMNFVEDGLHADSSVTYEFVKWKEGWNPFFIPRPTVQPGTSHFSAPPSLQVSALDNHLGRAAALERELDETHAELAILCITRVSERESAARVESMQCTLHHCNAAVANLDLDLEV